MMKPWQAPLNKAPSNGRKEEQREKTQVPATRSKTQAGSQKGAKEQILFQSTQVSIITIKTCCLLFVAHHVLIGNFNVNTQTHIYFT